LNVGVEHQSARLLLDSALVRVLDVTCTAPRSGYGAMESNVAPVIGLPRRGVFVVERRRERSVVDTNTVMLLGPDDEYRVSHPSDGGDAGTVLAFAPELLEDAIGGVGGRAAQLRPRAQFAARLFTRALARPEPDQLEGEDAALLLLASLAPVLAPGSAEARPALGPAQRLRVDRARALVAASPTERWDLGRLARTLGCSPFHLARQFRALTGETISRYVLRLRLAVALERLADGERDLAALAIGLGFAHHSHFTSRFRAAFGITPRDARELLTRADLAAMRATSGAGG
jgi:AraC family transcriptional regulator